MPDKEVTFNEPQIYNRGGPRQSWPTRVLIQYGLAKNVKQAQFILIAIFVLAITVMVVVWPRSNYVQMPPLEVTQP